MHVTTRAAARRKEFAPAFALTLLVRGIGAALPPCTLAQARNETIALTWRAAQGLGGEAFSLLGSPMLYASGQTAFRSVITGGTNTGGIFRSTGAITLTAIARTGQSALGPGGGTFTASYGAPQHNASDQTLFLSEITGSASVHSIFHSNSGNMLTTIARYGRQGELCLGVGTFASFGFWSLNDSGQAAFAASGVGAGANLSRLPTFN